MNGFEVRMAGASSIVESTKVARSMVVWPLLSTRLSGPPSPAVSSRAPNPRRERATPPRTRRIRTARSRDDADAASCQSPTLATHAPHPGTRAYCQYAKVLPSRLGTVASMTVYPGVRVPWPRRRARAGAMLHRGMTVPRQAHRGPASSPPTMAFSTAQHPGVAHILWYKLQPVCETYRDDFGHPARPYPASCAGFMTSSINRPSSRPPLPWSRCTQVRTQARAPDADAVGPVDISDDARRVQRLRGPSISSILALDEDTSPPSPPSPLKHEVLLGPFDGASSTGVAAQPWYTHWT
ncbi:hypothetical protein C8J57DRAFT_1721365 [Mycena rebaudengoi]|nr:hypothetical protein C8J57DRAFT_1721365 [Mycena rebaudengoi]